MKLEHFRALEFCGYKAHYERGLQRKTYSTLSKWEYLNKARIALSRQEYQLAALLIGQAEGIPDSLKSKSRKRKNKPQRLQGAGIVLRRVQDLSEY